MMWETKSQRKTARRAAGALLCGLAATFCIFSPDESRQSLRFIRSLSATEGPTAVKPYTRHDVLWTQRNFTEMNNLLIFDGDENTFRAYVGSREINAERARRYWPIYFLAHALRLNFPERFGPGKPSFQLLFSSHDLPRTNCLARPRECKTEAFAPILQFGSVPKDLSIMPSLAAMPLVPFIPCMIGEDCSVLQTPQNPPAWDDLEPQIVWRGSDFGFLHEFDLRLKTVTSVDLDPSSLTPKDVASLLRSLSDILTPRWRGVVESLQAKIDAERDGTLPWIDAKFFFPEEYTHNKNHVADTYDAYMEAGSDVATKTYMHEDEVVNYKYHIDFGGGGGTTWVGTLRKLAMPGLLFHHETLTKDWFHDEIKPWVHYVPIQMDLSDLRDKFEWAEQHPVGAQKIAEAGTDFVKNMKTGEYMKSTYGTFVDQLGDIVRAYQVSAGENHELTLEDYEAEGIPMDAYASCGGKGCVWYKRSGFAHTPREFSADDKTILGFMKR